MEQVRVLSTCAESHKESSKAREHKADGRSEDTWAVLTPAKLPDVIMLIVRVVRRGFRPFSSTSANRSTDVARDDLNDYKRKRQTEWKRKQGVRRQQWGRLNWTYYFKGSNVPRSPHSHNPRW